MLEMLKACQEWFLLFSVGIHRVWSLTSQSKLWHLFIGFNALNC